MFREASLVGLMVLCAGSVGAQTDPVVAWSFDEGEGTTAHDDRSGYLDGTLLGAGWTDGVRGGAVFLDGVEGYVDVPGSSGRFDPIGDLAMGTISVWFRFDSAPAADDIHPIFYFGGGGGSAGRSCIILEVGHYVDNRRLYFTVYNEYGSIPLCFDTVFNLEVNRWYHYAVVMGAYSNTAYLDGEELVGRWYNFGSETDREFFSDVVEERFCWIGRGAQGESDRQHYFHGAIDELRIYSRALSADEIRAYYDSVLGIERPTFLRGDADTDGDVSVSDAMAVVAVAILGEGELTCEDAADANDDGAVDISDAVSTLLALFGGAATLPLPGMEVCGIDPTWDESGCERYEECPAALDPILRAAGGEAPGTRPRFGQRH